MVSVLMMELSFLILFYIFLSEKIRAKLNGVATSSDKSIGNVINNIHFDANYGIVNCK